MYAHHFSLANMPFGIASSVGHPSEGVVTRLGDDVIFLDVLLEEGLLPSLSKSLWGIFAEKTLNPFASLPKIVHRNTRRDLQTLLGETPLSALPPHSTSPLSETHMYLPVGVGDFVDYACSKAHMLNAAEAMIRQRILPPAFTHFPLGYTGRASSVVVSGTGVVRPRGQVCTGSLAAGGTMAFGVTTALDYEVEVAAVVGGGSEMGRAVAVGEADEHIFGLVLVSDWSARDIQSVEMHPFGPFNGKSFCTSISPWVVTLDALEPFATAGPPREIPVASYLVDTKGKNTYDVHLRAEIIVDEVATTICKSELKETYWSVRDLVAHQTSNGCPIRTGDLLAVGTISGDSAEARGCLLELSNGGERAFDLEGGKGKRTYLEDGDMIRISGLAGDGVGFGECIGTILPAN